MKHVPNGREEKKKNSPGRDPRTQEEEEEEQPGMGPLNLMKERAVPTAGKVVI